MESVVGRRGGIGLSGVDEKHQRRSVATAQLLCDLQRESADQALLTLAALESCEQELLHTLHQGRRGTVEKAVAGY
jgi:hypothetical protein